MKVLKWIFIIVVAIVAVVLTISAFLPSERTLSQTLEMKKSPRLIFNQINSLKNWENWSPFLEQDPEMVSEYSGPDYGIGNRQEWKSKANGDGNMQIVESINNQKVVFDLDLGMGIVYPTWFVLERNPSAVIVTWGITLSNLKYPLDRLMWAMFSGRMNSVFMKGLTNLNKYLDEQPLDCIVGNIEIIEVPARMAMATRAKVNSDNIEEFMRNSFGTMMNLASSSKVQIQGVPLAFYEGDETTVEWGVTAALPVNKVPLKLPEGYFKFEIPKTKAVSIVHTGAYNTSGDSYYALIDFIMANGLEISGDSWEEYLSDPEITANPMELKTQICFPIK
jgi:effector-binding domain-containing protein